MTPAAGKHKNMDCLQTASEIPKEFKGLCQKCAHHSTCKAPCRPVHLVLNQDKGRTFEKPARGSVTVLYPCQGQTRESELSVHEDGKQTNRTKQIFSDENGSPFNTGTDKPKLMQTSVFVDRVFNRMSYKAIAVKYGVTEKTVQNEYENAKKRLFVVMKRLDSEECAGQVVKSVEGRMSKQVKAFLLYELFGLTNRQIARILKISKSTVLVHILRIRDLIIAGELKLLPYTDNDLSAAKYRLEKVRRTQRERLREKAAGDGAV